MREVLTFQWRVLTFRATLKEWEAVDLRHLAAGLVWVWFVGVGRWWDDPHAEPIQQAGIGSLAYVAALSLVFWLLGLPLRPRPWSFRRVLTAVCLTAPPAILYAIPVEHWMSMEGATWANLIFLLVVAIWRVSLWVFYLNRATDLGAWPVFTLTALPLFGILAVLTQLNMARGLVAIMGGLRDPSANDAANFVTLLLYALSFWVVIPVGVVYLFQIVARWRSSRIDTMEEMEVAGDLP